MRNLTSRGFPISPADVERIVPFEALLDRIAAEQEEQWVGRRRMLHAHPEPSGEERITTARICEILEQSGVSPQISSRGVGLFADLNIGTPDNDAPLIALRADIDALRMQDRKPTPYASSFPGLAHACGHDVHTTIVTAVAEILRELARRLPESETPAARFRFIFQPAEETAEGAAWMVQEGALNGVSAILGLHVDPTIEVGRVGIRYGVLTAHVDEVMFVVEGRGGHAARPQHTTDPLASAALLVTSLYQVVPRRSDALCPTVFTIGMIHGGTASNVIPDRIELQGTLRTTDARVRTAVMETIHRTCEGLTTTTGNQIRADFSCPLGAVINDVTTMSACEAASIQVLGGENLVLIDKPSMGGEDFAVYLEYVPGAQFRLGCAGSIEGWPLLHSPVFDVDERAISIGARILTRAALLLALRGPDSEMDTA
jgi:amidohydrolase